MEFYSKSIEIWLQAPRRITYIPMSDKKLGNSYLRLTGQIYPYFFRLIVPFPCTTLWSPHLVQPLSYHYRTIPSHELPPVLAIPHIEDSFRSLFFSVGKSKFPAEIPHFAFVGIIFVKGSLEVWHFSSLKKKVEKMPLLVPPEYSR